MAHFRIENLTFTYPSRSAPAINGISLEIHEGEFFAVCGKSGSGKTTLLRLLKPALAPHGELSGDISLDGMRISDMDFRTQSQKIGFVLQNPDNQLVCDKVWHELAFGLENLGIPTAEIRARVAETASFFGIQDWFYKSVSELSGGQKQLLCLASVMVMHPEILILDEPTSQLDPIAASDFLSAVRKINLELGTTVIMTEHRLEEVFPLADRVLVMEDGAISALGMPQSVGVALADSGSDMSLAMPTPIRVHTAIKNNLACPLTVREGRNWLDEISKKKTPDPSLIPACSETAKGPLAIKLSDMYFRYEKTAPDIARGLSLDVLQGELHAIVGGNGAGKTTALLLISGALKAQRGSIKLLGQSETDRGLVAMLPQNPESLFVGNTVLEDLEEMTEEKDALDEISTLCRISHLLSAHPYDLSGGEKERVALAKVLLTNPKILLLDEPTKGLDAHFKEELAGVLKKLIARGTTVLMVSHDIEFCAKHADRVSMFFDGKIVSTGTARSFLENKSFYTTAANRMARHKLKSAITAEDIILALGGKAPEAPQSPDIPETYAPFAENEKTAVPERQKRSFRSFAAGAFFLLSILLYALFSQELKGDGHFLIKLTEIFFICAFFACILPRKGASEKCGANSRRIQRRTVFALIFALISAVLTIYIGVRWLGDRKYYIISLFLILEVLLPFMISFEKRHPSARELTLIAVLCAIAIASRAAFFVIPQFKPLCAIVIIAGAALGCESGFLIGALSAFISNMFFGQGPWTPWQMLALSVIGLLAGLLFRKNNFGKLRLPLALFGAFSAFVIYGGIMNPASVLIWQPHPEPEMFILAYLQGIPFDALHAASTFIFLLLLSAGMIDKIERVKLKYGFMTDTDKINGGHK